MSENGTTTGYLRKKKKKEIPGTGLLKKKYKEYEEKSGEEVPPPKTRTKAYAEEAQTKADRYAKATGQEESAPQGERPAEKLERFKRELKEAFKKVKDKLKPKDKEKVKK